ncbi:MAG: HAD hydrolase family protein [Ignavibacteriales bacterium]|nr:HAD hydrolase family protein [Ignavibacteriales bacterium]
MIDNIISLKEKIKKIKLIITDIDGVWTDGGLYYTTDGLVMKRFQVKDGMAVNLLKEKGIEIAIVSGDASEIGIVRGQKLKIDLLYKNVLDKKKVLDEICQLRNLKYENIAYIGDDVNDLEALKVVSISAAPSDAVKEVLSEVDYVSSRKGGEGAFRDFADLIISNLDK